VLLASVSLLFLLLIAVAILHCIVRRRQRETSSNWTSSRSLCLITPQGAKGAKGADQVYVLELSAASARDVEKALQSSLNSQHTYISPVCPSNEKVDAQSQGKVVTTSDSTIFSYLFKLGAIAFHAN
jgi:hypothetical protein